MSVEPSIDRHARKQVLLTRIAFERVELRRQVAQVRKAAQLPQMLRSVVGGGLGSGGSLGRKLLGGPGQPGWLATAWSLLRRYRVASTLLSGLSSLLRGGGRWQRLLKLGVVGVTAWFGWRAARGRNKG